MAILSSVEQFLNNCKETITGWFSTWANTNIKGKYLPLTGGTLTGEVTVNDKLNAENGIFRVTDNGRVFQIETGVETSDEDIDAKETTGADILNIDVGWNYAKRDGALIGFRSEDFPSNPGGLDLYTRTSERSYTLSLTNDGRIVWNGPIPESTENSGHLATTAWVNNRIASIPSVGTYTLPTASSNVKGGVKIGNGLQITNEAINIKLPTGSNLSVDANGLKCTYKYTHHTQDTISFGPTNNATIANGGTFQIPQIAVDGEGHTTSITARTMTLPKYAAGTGITINGNTISSTVASLSIGTATGTGNAITGLSISNNQIVPTLGSKFSLEGHTHSGYAASNHNHDSVYSKTTHNHDSVYAAKSHTHSYAPLASPELTGTPKAPTATAGTNTTQIATTAFVGTAVSNALSSVSVNLNLSAAIVSSKYVSGNVGAVVSLFDSEASSLIFPTGTTWLVVGYNYTAATDRPEDNTPESYSRIGQVVTIASNASISNRVLSSLVPGSSRAFGFAIRIA